MLAFGLRIASIRLAIVLAAHGVVTRLRGRMMQAGGQGKRVLGALIVAVGLPVLTGTDRVSEGYVVQASPDWLTISRRRLSRTRGLANIAPACNAPASNRELECVWRSTRLG